MTGTVRKHILLPSELSDSLDAEVEAQKKTDPKASLNKLIVERLVPPVPQSPATTSAPAPTTDEMEELRKENLRLKNDILRMQKERMEQGLPRVVKDKLAIAASLRNGVATVGEPSRRGPTIDVKATFENGKWTFPPEDRADGFKCLACPERFLTKTARRDHMVDVEKWDAGRLDRAGVLNVT